MNKKQISPNQLAVAKGQMAKFLKAGVELPETINEDEKHLFHVALVESRPNSKTLEFDHKLVIQMYNDRSWFQAKENLKRLGHSQVYILHDPTKKEDKGNTGVAGNGNKVDRNKVIEEAVALGYTGAMNVKTKVFEEFIAEKKAEANGSNGAEGGEEAGNTGGDGSDQ